MKLLQIHHKTLHYLCDNYTADIYTTFLLGNAHYCLSCR